MKKLISALMITVSLLSMKAAEAKSDLSSYNISLKAGYTSQLVINGVARHGEGAGFYGLAFDKGLSLASVHGSADLLPQADGSSQSHWNVGIGKEIKFGDWGLGFSGDAFYHQHATGISDSTEVAGTVTLINPYLTVFGRVLSDFDLQQDGYSIGATKTLSIVNGDNFNLDAAPSLEWFQYSDYSSLVAAFNLSASFENGLLSHVQPFATISYIDNEIDVANARFSSEELDGDVNFQLGLKYSF
jgi:hypothetical protein